MSEIPFSGELVSAGVGEPIMHAEKLKQIENDPSKIIRALTFKRLEEMYLHKGLRVELNEVIKTCKQLYQELKEKYGIPVSADFVIGKNENDEKVIYVISDRIDGDDLSQLGKEKLRELKGELDDLYHSVITYFTEKLLSGEYYLVDIFKPEQYVYGTAPDQQEDKIHLVDTDIYFHKSKTGIYANVVETTKYLQVLEQLTGEKFDHARQALKELLDVELEFHPQDILSPRRIKDCRMIIENFLVS
jgi:hypothetical protein